MEQDDPGDIAGGVIRVKLSPGSYGGESDAEGTDRICTSDCEVTYFCSDLHSLNT